ncbi:uncharacterized protein LOC128558225 [Mercenaria mercenaria]|uniref:uncharacterized protein LOC128558225 n=1 Tax=Mercenaria mercenaria TaxID=6596 RepID=UPI00234EDA30|nr:uncharacterized protein LOC128558225 [Mercenaria mercenaria]
MQRHKMEYMLLIILFLNFVSSSLAEDVNNKLKTAPESRDFEELKEYVATSITHMAAKHANDMQGLKNLIDTHGRQIQTLQSDNLAYVSIIRELKKEIEEMKTNGVKVECDTNSNKRKSTEESVIAANTVDQRRSESAQNLRSSTLKERRGHQNRIRRSIVGTNVAFFASMTGYIQHLGINQDIVFDHAVTNIGNAYNQHHGTFVAPVGGTYVFSVTLLQFGENTWGHFVVNRAVVAKLLLKDGQSASQTIVVNLSTGDDVSVQNTGTDRGFHGDRYCTFSGFLLNEDLSDTQIVG